MSVTSERPVARLLCDRVGGRASSARSVPTPAMVRSSRRRYNRGSPNSDRGMPGKETEWPLTWAPGPDFTLMNQDREPVTLSEELKKGPVVLGSCRPRSAALYHGDVHVSDRHRAERASARVLGITVDTFFALGAWRKAEKLNETLLSDFNKDVIRAYGVVDPD